MTAFQTDDYYNVIPEHAIEALQSDAKLGTGAALAITTWEQEPRENLNDYNENELPAVAVTCDLSVVAEATTGTDRRTYMLTLWVVTTGARLQEATKEVKAYAARIERVMMQQHDSSKQLSNVTADLLEAESGTVVVTSESTAFDGGTEAGNLRGMAIMTFGVSIDFIITIDS